MRQTARETSDHDFHMTIKSRKGSTCHPLAQGSLCSILIEIMTVTVQFS